MIEIFFPPGEWNSLSLSLSFSFSLSKKSLNEHRIIKGGILFSENSSKSNFSILGKRERWRRIVKKERKGKKWMLLGKWDAVISFRVYEENVVFYEENNFVYVAKCNIKRCGACERISIPRLRDKSVNYFHGTQTYFKAVARTCMFRKTHLSLNILHVSTYH